MTPFSGTNQVTSVFGNRKNPVTGQKEHHNGIDIINPSGNWMVRSCTGGTVSNVYRNPYRGLVVEVRTPDGAVERYQHLASNAVNKGDAAPQGHLLGMAGTTGQSTGRHLHFEVIQNGNPVDPSPWLGLPNQVGTYNGNNNIDGSAPAPPPQAPPPNPTSKYKVGDRVKITSGYLSSTDTTDKALHVAKGQLKRDVGTITKIVEGARNPYLLDNGFCWVNDGDIKNKL